MFLLNHEKNSVTVNHNSITISAGFESIMKSIIGHWGKSARIIDETWVDSSSWHASRYLFYCRSHFSNPVSSGVGGDGHIIEVKRRRCTRRVKCQVRSEALCVDRSGVSLLCGCPFLSCAFMPQSRYRNSNTASFCIESRDDPRGRSIHCALKKARTFTMLSLSFSLSLSPSLSHILSK